MGKVLAVNTKTTVFHHSADYDGIFCREIARKFLPDAELIGWDFSDPARMLPEGLVYVLDLPVDRVFGYDFTKGLPADFDEVKKNLIWIDHHKSSIDSHPSDIPGYRIDGVAACRLAYQWFALLKMTPVPEEIGLPDKEHYIDRKVVEPVAVRLAGEYDIWDKRDWRADILQFGLRSRELTEYDWGALLSVCRPTIDELEGLIAVGHDRNLIEPDGTSLPAVLHGLLDAGTILRRYQQRTDVSVMSRSFIVEWEGLKLLALNTARCNSLSFAAKDKPETGHDALMGFYYDGKGWNVSLYHAEHRKDLDLSKIAVRYSGGGHRGACGFRCKILPFIA